MAVIKRQPGQWNNDACLSQASSHLTRDAPWGLSWCGLAERGCSLPWQGMVGGTRKEEVTCDVGMRDSRIIGSGAGVGILGVQKRRCLYRRPTSQKRGCIMEIAAFSMEIVSSEEIGAADGGSRQKQEQEVEKWETNRIAGSRHEPKHVQARVNHQPWLAPEAVAAASRSTRPCTQSGAVWMQRRIGVTCRGESCQLSKRLTWVPWSWS